MPTKAEHIRALEQTAQAAVSMVGYANYQHREAAAHRAVRKSAETGRYVDPDSLLEE
jgi:hypothetical protein